MSIRTPEDEVTTPGYFYLPFNEGDWYEGQTYGGHTDFSVDWNKRTKNGGWLDDRGEPVRAAANGTVSLIEKANGAVFVDHWNGTFRTEYRHMDPVLVKIGDKVKRGDILGRIGAVGISPSSGFEPSPHLHHVHWKKVKGAWTRIQQSFYGQPVPVSVGDSDSRPKTWKPPKKVLMQGPPPRATWESAYREAVKVYEKRIDTVEEELATALTDLQSANDRIAILESAQAPDLTEVKRAARQSFKDEVLALPI